MPGGWEDDMRIFALRMGGLIATAALVTGAIMIGNSQPASAHGGIVCEYDSAKYRRCCAESYGKHPKLGSRARADEIDACVNRPAKKPKG